MTHAIPKSVLEAHERMEAESPTVRTLLMRAGAHPNLTLHLLYQVDSGLLGEGVEQAVVRIIEQYIQTRWDRAAQNECGYPA